MSETEGKTIPVCNRERITEQTCASYDEARLASQHGPRNGKVKNFDECDKIKIFARSNGTFEVVWYRKSGATEAPKAVAQAPETVQEATEKPVHGLRSKDRKKSPKKAR